jgi:diguanylate cyclase (GGDEF)-like protein
MSAFSMDASPVCRLVRSGRVWLCDDDLGISRAVAYILAQDHRGYMWVGTEAGPVIFDGLVWSSPPGLCSLSGSVIRALALDTRRLYLGTDGAGLHIVDLASTPYHLTAHLSAELPSPRVHALCAGRDGEVWAGTHAGLALVRDGQVVTRVTADDGLPEGPVWSLCYDQQDRLWVATKGGLVLIDGQGIRRVGPAQGIHQVCCDAAGWIWAAQVGGAIVRVIADDSRHPIVLPAHSTGARVRALCPDERGRLWVGTSDGVHLLEDGVARDRWTRDDGMPGKEVWALLRDAEGRTWASTMTGLVLLEDLKSPVRIVAARADTLAAPVYACVRDDRNRIWLGTETGLQVLDAASATPLPLPALPTALTQESIWSLTIDSHGRLWCGTDGKGLLAINLADGTLVTHLAPTRHVPVLCREGEDYLWAGITGYGLVRIDLLSAEIVLVVTGETGLPQENVQGLEWDRTGRLWAGTWSGALAALDPAGGVVRRTLVLGPAEAPWPVTDLCRDEQGLLWVATYGGGLVAVDPERGEVARRVTVAEGLPTNLLYSSLCDQRGNVWVGTRRGVARYSPATGRCLVIGRALGLPSEECNSHALCRDNHARMWVGTVQGAAAVDMDRIPDWIAPCTVDLTGVTVMGQNRATGPDLEIEDSDFDLVFTYAAVSFTAPRQVRYRLRLVGLEQEWSTPTQLRFARYTNLRPGAYTFLVCARNWGGVWGEPLAVPLTVVRNRAAQQLEEEMERQRIEKEVAQATAALFERMALHDGLTGLLNRRALDERLVQEYERARRHAHPWAVALLDLDNFKGINDTHGHLMGDEVLKVVAQLCRRAVREVDSVARYGGEEFMVLFPESTTETAALVCERLRQQVAAYQWDRLAPGLRVTISGGLAGWSEVSSVQDLLQAADSRLYQAKLLGRNRIRAGEGAPSRLT